MIDGIKVVIAGSGGGTGRLVAELLAVLNASPSIVICKPTEFIIHDYHADIFDAPPALYCDRLNIPESNQASAHRSRSGKHKSKSKHASPYGV